MEDATLRIFWNPLEQSWLSFLGDGLEREIVGTWVLEDENPLLAAGGDAALLMRQQG